MGQKFTAGWNSLTMHIVKFKLAMKNETLSLDGEKLIPAVGAECGFIHETYFFFKKNKRKRIKKIYTVN